MVVAQVPSAGQIRNAQSTTIGVLGCQNIIVAQTTTKAKRKRQEILQGHMLLPMEFLCQHDGLLSAVSGSGALLSRSMDCMGSMDLPSLYSAGEGMDRTHARGPDSVWYLYGSTGDTVFAGMATMGCQCALRGNDRRKRHATDIPHIQWADASRFGNGLGKNGRESI
mmetsp:Transcript_63435/g.175449  ORF Transcript_63435/g.175449 Transcript_63435/m.175449 type:complete len:167 (-) Transcript_63435:48-548(-)